MSDGTVHIKLLNGFTDPAISAGLWNGLLQTGGNNTVFLTFQYQKTWWEVFGRGRLLLTAAYSGGQLIAIAPMFEDGQMIFFVGSGCSDYLGFVGDVSDDGILNGILQTAKAQVPGFLGFRFYHVPNAADQAANLSSLTTTGDWDIIQEGSWPCPQLDIKNFPEQAEGSTRKKSLMRSQAWFEKNGGFETHHYTSAPDILPLLNEFFEQHISRWAATDYPSLFHDHVQRKFYARLTETCSPAGWLRFTCLKWQGQFIAFHFGFFYEGSFLWYKPTFNLTLAKHNPGEVLLRQLILYAIEHGAHCFDFGLGEEAFKMRFATNVPEVINTGLYPVNIPCNA